jgi:hypothetical protein
MTLEDWPLTSQEQGNPATSPEERQAYKAAWAGTDGGLPPSAWRSRHP